MPSVRGSIASFHDGADPTIFRTLSRRQSVATMAWKGLRSRMKSGTLVSYLAMVLVVVIINRKLFHFINLTSNLKYSYIVLQIML